MTLDIFYTANYHYFLRYARTLTLSNAEDLVQSAFQRIIESNYHRLTKAVICTIIKHTFINEYRKNKLEQRFLEKQINKTEDPSENSDFVNKVLSENDELSLYIQGFKYQEIATKKAESLSTVKTRIMRKRLVLRRSEL